MMAGKAVGNQETDQERSGRRDRLLHFRGRAAARPAGAKEAMAVCNRRGALQRAFLPWRSGQRESKSCKIVFIRTHFLPPQWRSTISTLATRSSELCRRLTALRRFSPHAWLRKVAAKTNRTRGNVGTAAAPYKAPLFRKQNAATFANRRSLPVNPLVSPRLLSFC